LLWRAIEYEIMQECDRYNIDILAYSPLQQGLLTGKFSDASSVPEGRRRTKHFKADRCAYWRKVSRLFQVASLSKNMFWADVKKVKCLNN